jgi:rod shape-determining protein MreB
MKVRSWHPFPRRLIGIDLGTANTLVIVPGEGIVLNEPSVVAVSLEENKILAVGAEAKEMLGRTPEDIMASVPLQDGVIADYRITEAMLRYFINKALPQRVRWRRPDVMVAVPAGITSTERRAVIDATLAAGARQVYLVKEPVAAAIGAGIPLGEPSGHMIIDIGGGTTEVAVLSLGGIVALQSARVGGMKMDRAIVEYIRTQTGLAVGTATAERIKIKIGSALPTEEERSVTIRGRDATTGLPREVAVRTNEITEAIREELDTIIQTVKQVLQETPPELAADVIDKGIVMTGGGALLRNLDRLLTAETHVPCYLADDPLLAVVKGCGLALENLSMYRRSLMLTR